MCTCEKENWINKQQSNAELGDDLFKQVKYLASAVLTDTTLSPIQ